MIRTARAATICLLLGLSACSQQKQGPEPPAGAPVLQGVASAATTPVSGPRSSEAIANSPDRGVLVDYDRGTGAQKQGAFTSHPVQVSEDHAIRAIVTGNLSIPAPDGQRLQLKYERHAESANGNWTWVGRLVGGNPGQEAIITFGEKAVFGSVPQGRGRPDLSLTTRAGKLWVVETDPRLAPGLDRRKQDTLLPVAAAARSLAASSPAGTQVSASTTASATVSSSNTIDVLLGYTSGFAAKFGGQSQAVTRLTHLVEVNNQAYSNSQINGTVRLVGTQQVNYTDGGTNRAALIDLTGSDGSRATTVPASLQPLRAARETLGADLVALVRAYEFVNEGCGIAWLLGAEQQPILPSEDSRFGYSIVSNLPDGSSVKGTDGKNYFCSKDTLAHELGHLMGSAHDIENAKNDDEQLRYGRYSYSFGAKTDSITGNFYTVMSYGDDGQTSYRVFSNPSVAICGGFPCGVANQSDNARSLNQTIPIVAFFRNAVIASARAAWDFNSDGRSDILWRNLSTGVNTIWPSASTSSEQAVTRLANLAWVVAGVNDFNGDGRADILWRNTGSGANMIWPAADSAAERVLAGETDLAWRVVGTGDFDGDGSADVLWRNSVTGMNRIWRSGNASSTQAVTRVGNLAWIVAGVGDFNNDGRSDILWRNTSTGANTIWPSASTANERAVVRVANQAWMVAGIGDFTGDGVSDILWRNTSSGVNTIWPAGSTVGERAVTRVANLAWTVAAVGDYNGDGRSDILWRNTASGANTIWPSAGTANEQAVTRVANQDWQIIGR